MGADIYLYWDGMTEDDKKKQICGFDITNGKNGYLRGAYNGHVGYDAICILFDGISWEKDWKVCIKKLQENLEKLEIGLFKERKKDFYKLEGKEVEMQSYRDFVKLAIKLFEEGKRPKVHFSY